MTTADVINKVIHGWMIDKKISIPTIIAVLSVIITGALYLNDLKKAVADAQKDTERFERELDEQKRIVGSLPERVARIETHLEIATKEQNRAFEEILYRLNNSFIVETRPGAVRAKAVKRATVH